MKPVRFVRELDDEVAIGQAQLLTADREGVAADVLCACVLGDEKRRALRWKATLQVSRRTTVRIESFPSGSGCPSTL